MSDQATRADAPCPDCGGPKYRYASFCSKCKSKGERNSRYGATLGEETRRKMREAALARPRKPRMRRSTRPEAGREFARRWFSLPAVCRRCGQAPPRDRHHQDANPHNNDPSNIDFLCRRCHQETDGRIEMLRSLGKAQAAATHCKRGHPFDEANTYVCPKTKHRCCKTCRQAAVLRYRARKRDAAMARERIAAVCPLADHADVRRAEAQPGLFDEGET